MRIIKFNSLAVSLRRTILAGLLSVFLIHATNAQPVISLPVWGTNQSHAQLTLSNCNGTNVQYVIQMSTNLTDWLPLQTNAPSATNFSVTVPATNQVCFYRVMAFPTLWLPISSFGILCKSNFSVAGNNCSFDSFDSSNPAYNTGGNYDVTKREANVNIGTDSTITNALNIGNGNVYGTLYTGVGTKENSVFIMSNGSVGDLAWAPNMSGIQPGHWIGNLNVNIPDVAAPNTTGWKTALPAIVNGAIPLNGGSYVTSAPITYPLLVTAPTTLWVKSSLSVGVTITNTGSLILYVGNTSGSGNTLSWSSSGTINYPGFATKLQIYGLPSLTAINIIGNTSCAAVIYAPEANFAGASGSTLGDFSGQIVANNLIANSHWNFHYDESLAAAGLLY